MAGVCNPTLAPQRRLVGALGSNLGWFIPWLVGSGGEVCAPVAPEEDRQYDARGIPPGTKTTTTPHHQLARAARVSGEGEV